MKVIFDDIRSIRMMMLIASVIAIVGLSLFVNSCLRNEAFSAAGQKNMPEKGNQEELELRLEPPLPE